VFALYSMLRCKLVITQHKVPVENVYDFENLLALKSGNEIHDIAR
jgi:hypothetical protein